MCSPASTSRAQQLLVAEAVRQSIGTSHCSKAILASPPWPRQRCLLGTAYSDLVGRSSLREGHVTRVPRSRRYRWFGAAVMGKPRSALLASRACERGESQLPPAIAAPVIVVVAAPPSREELIRCPCIIAPRCGPRRPGDPQR